MIICCCEHAIHNCEKFCKKGLAIKPQRTYNVRGWKKRVIKYDNKKEKLL